MLYTLTIFQDAAGEYRWRMKARNGRIVADSGEGYVTRAGAIKAAKRIAGSRIVVAE